MEQEPYSAWLAYSGEADSPETQERFKESYQGEWDSETEYIENFLDDTGVNQQVDELRKQLGSLGMYLTIDADGLLNDMQLGGDIYIHEREDRRIYVFWCL